MFMSKTNKQICQFEGGGGGAPYQLLKKIKEKENWRATPARTSYLRLNANDHN